MINFESNCLFLNKTAIFRQNIEIFSKTVDFFNKNWSFEKVFSEKPKYQRKMQLYYRKLTAKYFNCKLLSTNIIKNNMEILERKGRRKL